MEQFGSAQHGFAVSSDAESLVVAISVDLDLAGAERFGVVVERLRPLDQPLTLDLADVGFLDSSGLRALLLANRVSVEDTQTPVVLRGVPERVRRLIEAAGLDDVLH